VSVVTQAGCTVRLMVHILCISLFWKLHFSVYFSSSSWDFKS